MSVNLKVLLVGISLLMGQAAEASYSVMNDSSYMTVTKMRISEVSRDVLNQETLDVLYRKNIMIEGLPTEIGSVNPIDTAGKVVQIGRDLVALGEDIYKLVIKGKPSVTTKYTPISVIPKVNGEPVDILETEMWKAPIKRTYEVSWENIYGMTITTFRYSVIFAYGGTYNGKGAYLTAVQVVPESVMVSFGFDFTATMKLGGIQNQGTRLSPIAGATLLIEYTVNSVMSASSQVDSFFVTGRGEFKKL